MIRRGAVAAVLALFCAVSQSLAAPASGASPGASVLAPTQSLRPQARPGGGGTQAAIARALDLALASEAGQGASSALALAHSLRPQARNLPVASGAYRQAAISEALAQAQSGPTTRRSALAPARSLRPQRRAPAVERSAQVNHTRRLRGAVCGTTAIQGEPVGPVPGKLAGCGVADAVRVHEVSGVRLSPPAVITCDTARALNTWVQKGLKPAFRRRGPVVEMRVAAHYACRTRNNRPGARISEHGRGKAIDLSAFVMKDGEVVTVLNGWKKGTTYRPLSRAHRAACGPFGTVLGPEADRYHRDHFHFDTARHRGGRPFCQ